MEYVKVIAEVPKALYDRGTLEELGVIVVGILDEIGDAS